MECRRRTEGSGCYAKPDGLPVAVGNPVPSLDRSDYSPIRHCYSKAHPSHRETNREVCGRLCLSWCAQA